MNSGIASLHKILKDETRQNIVLQLNEKGILSYTELMDNLGFLTTGLLNYHLKVLDDLIAKNDDGKYALTERGKLAAKLLVEFPENVVAQNRVPTWWRKFWLGVGAVTVGFLALNFSLYFLGYIDQPKLYQCLLWNVAAIAIAYMIQHMTRDVLSKRVQLLMDKVAYTMLGVWVGLLLAFFGMIAAILVSRSLNGPDIGRMEGGGEIWIALTASLMILGGKWGYGFGKKRDFKRPELDISI